MMRAIAAVAWFFLTGQILLAQPAEFGDAVSGVRAALAHEPDGLVLQVKNDGASSIRASDAFAWLLVVQSREEAWFSEKLPLGKIGVLAAGETGKLPVPIAGMKFQRYAKGMKVVDSYPQGESEAAAFGSIPPTSRVQAIVALKAEGERVSAKSRPVPIVRPAEASQPPADAGLLQQFRRSAFSAQAAHARAVKLGPAVAQTLEEGLKDSSMPGYGRMWIATALVDIGGEPARRIAPVLAEDPMEGVRSVLAFHGPKLRDEKVDEVILARARAGTDPMFTAWAARGFAEQKRAFPRDLIDAAYVSKEPRARAEVAHVLAASSDRADLDRLAALFSDENELVRVAAADSVREHTVKTKPIAKAMVDALKMPGESAKARIVESLAKVWQKPWIYDVQATEEARLSVIGDIRASDFGK